MTFVDFLLVLSCLVFVFVFVFVLFSHLPLHGVYASPDHSWLVPCPLAVCLLLKVYSFLITSADFGAPIVLWMLEYLVD